jgi:hypothetical protein
MKVEILFLILIFKNVLCEEMKNLKNKNKLRSQKK